MLTEEQIKNLKPGDPIVINGTVFKITEDGHILATCGGSAVWLDNPDNLTLPLESPKHNPTRPFKEGDRVRYCERDGRKLFRLQDGAIYEVKSNEGDAGTVEIWLWKEAVRYGSYPYNVFELVTPVEEQGPYRVVWPENYRCVRIMKEKRIYNSIPFDEEECVYRTLEEAKAAAEAECKRLNAEWRKE